MADGIRHDIFLHLVDEWWAGEIERQRAAGLEDDDDDGDFESDLNQEIADGFRDFVDCKGDLFRNSTDLARHVKEWVALYGGEKRAEGRRIVEGVLEMWRLMEPKRRGTKRRETKTKAKPKE